MVRHGPIGGPSSFVCVAASRLLRTGPLITARRRVQWLNASRRGAHTVSHPCSSHRAPVQLARQCGSPGGLGIQLSMCCDPASPGLGAGSPPFDSPEHPVNFRGVGGLAVSAGSSGLPRSRWQGLRLRLECVRGQVPSGNFLQDLSGLPHDLRWYGLHYPPGFFLLNAERFHSRLLNALSALECTRRMSAPDMHICRSVHVTTCVRPCTL